MSCSALQAFLEDVLGGHRLKGMSEPRANSLGDWIEFLEQSLGLVAISMSSNALLGRHSLSIALHSRKGPVLIKSSSLSLFAGGMKVLVLSDGDIFELGSADDLSDVKVMVEVLSPDGRLKTGDLGDFILKPVRQGMVGAVLLQLLQAFLSSTFFLTNYAVLAYVVPAQSVETYFALVWLVLVIVCAVFVSNWISLRVQAQIDAVIEQRTEVVRLSLLRSLHPSFLRKNGVDLVLRRCKSVADAGRNRAELVLMGVSSVAILPVLVLMFFRLPGPIFASTIFVAIIGSVAGVMLRWRAIGVERRLGVEEDEAERFLHNALNSLARFRFYGVIDRILTLWSIKRTEIAQARLLAASDLEGARELESVLGDFTQVLSILFLSLMLSVSSEGGEVISVASVFIIFHLVRQTYYFMPRVAELLLKARTLKLDLQDSEWLMGEVEVRRLGGGERITQGCARVEFAGLRLPHGCRFEGDSTLTTSFDGPRVVRVAGDSGAGKTVFLNCLLGMELPVSGSITVFGVDPVGMYPCERRRVFAYADQGGTLIPGLLRDNLKWFASEFTGDREIWEALEHVFMAERIRKLPLGLDTPIADVGRSFSTGERQRLVLAQCVISRRKILILDEATSGLPSELEEAIFGNLCALFQLIFYVSHRENLHKFADATICMESRW